VPFSAKDNIFTAGVRTTFASLLFESFVPAADASCVRQLGAAGGMLLGKANLPEFSSWVRSRNRVTDECVNPWDVTRTCGASSGGSGRGRRGRPWSRSRSAPTTAGRSDSPAALNGVYGFFPSPGRVAARRCGGDRFGLEGRAADA